MLQWCPCLEEVNGWQGFYRKPQRCHGAQETPLTSWGGKKWNQFYPIEHWLPVACDRGDSVVLWPQQGLAHTDAHTLLEVVVEGNGKAMAPSWGWRTPTSITLLAG